MKEDLFALFFPNFKPVSYVVINFSLFFKHQLFPSGTVRWIKPGSMSLGKAYSEDSGRTKNQAEFVNRADCVNA